MLNSSARGKNGKNRKPGRSQVLCYSVAGVPEETSSSKIVPQDVDAEKSVLGALLLDKDAVIKVAAKLAVEDFFEPAHREIYKTIQELYNKGSAVDMVTVASALKSKGTLSEAGGRAYLADITSLLPTASNVEYYAKIVKEKGVRRRLIQMGGKLSALGGSKEELSELLNQAEKGIFEISLESAEEGFVHIKDLLMEAYERAETISQHGVTRGVPTGFKPVDNVLGGFQPSDLVIIAARPSVGKTSFVLDVARHMAVHGNKKVGFFSLEMSRDDLADRLIAMEARIDLWGLRMGKLKRPDWRKVSDAMGVLHETEMYIDDLPGQNILELRTKARRVQIERGLDILFVDYLQLIQGTNKESRVQEVTEISQMLKNMARELRIPVVAVSQLSRAVEQRNTRVPQLSDLRESGAIEQDADVVMFIHREEMYDRETEKKGIADIIISKHRNGPCGTVELAFIANQARFAELERSGADGEVAETEQDIEKLMEG